MKYADVVIIARYGKRLGGLAHCHGRYRHFEISAANFLSAACELPDSKLTRLGTEAGNTGAHVGRHNHGRGHGDHLAGTVEGSAALIDGKLEFGIAEKPLSPCTRPTRPVGQGQALPSPSELRSVGLRGDWNDI